MTAALPYQLGITGSSTQITTTLLGGSASAVLRVVASDGANTTYGDTPPFSLAAKPPQPVITTPASGLTINYGQLVNFSGFAYDLQDSGVASANLAWSSQGGPLGSGELLSVQDLPVGTNIITLTATNSAGLTASTSITVIVNDDLSLPGPILSAAPGQVGWHVSNGTTQPLTYTVNIANAGGSELAWIASEDADWLSLDITSGNAPSTLTLITDPSGLEGNTSVSAVLTITSPANGEHAEQTVTIQVTLSMGNTWRGPVLVAGYKIYLPVTIR